VRARGSPGGVAGSTCPGSGPTGTKFSSGRRSAPGWNLTIASGRAGDRLLVQPGRPAAGIVQQQSGLLLEGRWLAPVAPRHAGRVSFCRPFPGRQASGGGFGPCLAFYDTSAGREVRRLQVWEGGKGTPFYEIWSLAFSPNGKLLVGGCSDRIVRIWEAETGKLLHAPTGGRYNGIQSVAISSDSKTGLSVGFDRISLWDLGSGKALARLGDFSKGATRCAFSPDGRSFFTCNEDGSLSWWDVASK
jgi:WD40 repeat protein